MRPPLAETLDLQPHPEGGWYRQTWRSPVEVALPDGRVRPTATAILFLLVAGESSAWHRVASEEVWLAHTGSVRLQRGGYDARPVAGAARTGGGADGGVEVVGLGRGEVAQAVVRAGEWQRTLPGDADALVSCVVSPGFDFADFELA